MAALIEAGALATRCGLGMNPKRTIFAVRSTLLALVIRVRVQTVSRIARTMRFEATNSSIFKGLGLGDALLGYQSSVTLRFSGNNFGFVI
jgi:hypothetical protein